MLSVNLDDMSSRLDTILTKKGIGILRQEQNTALLIASHCIASFIQTWDLRPLMSASLSTQQD